MSNSAFKYHKGEVYLIEEQPGKMRPWLLVGASPINAARSTVMAVPLSKSIPEKAPLSIQVSLNRLLSCVVLDQVRAIDKRRLIKFEGCLSFDEMNVIDESMRMVLAL